MSIYDNENLREYKPVYNDDRDYTTNAPTYYDYMAEANKMVQKAYEDISDLVEGDIIQSIDSDDTTLLEVTKKRVKDKIVTYTLKPKEKDTTITGDPQHGLTVTKTDNHNFSITVDDKVVGSFLVDGTGIYLTKYNGQYRLNVDFTRVQAKLTFQDGVKLSGTTVSTDWNKVQKVLRPDNKSIIIDEDGNISAQIAYDRLQGKIDKWRNVGNVAGALFNLGADAQPTTVNPAFLRKTGTYFYLSRSKSDNAVWGGAPDTITGQQGFIRVTSTNYDTAVLQEFIPIDGQGIYFRVGSESMRETNRNRHFWGEWRAVFNDYVYDVANSKFTDQKGKMWAQGKTYVNWESGNSSEKYGTELPASDLSTIYKLKEKYTSADKVLRDRIRFGYEPAQLAGDCLTGSNMYYKLNNQYKDRTTVEIVAHNAINGNALSSFNVNHAFFANTINDISVANDRIYFVSDSQIFWLSLNDYSTGFISFTRTNNKACDGTNASYNKHCKFKGISYYNDKLYVLVQEDYKDIDRDGNLQRGNIYFAVWEITLNVNGTGNVSDRCLFKNILTGVNMQYLQLCNNKIYVGFDLDRLYNSTTQSAYGSATISNKYAPCGIGLLTFTMSGLLEEFNEMSKEGLRITGLGHNYNAARPSENSSSLNADGCINGYYDDLLISGYHELKYTGVFSITTSSTILPTVEFSKASKISYNSAGEAVVTSQIKNENGETETVTVDLHQRTKEAFNYDTPIVE